MAKTPPPKSVTITYDLFDLPTAQHKAGLAGLLLQIDSMRNRNIPAPCVVSRSATQATIEFTEATVQSLFNDVYAAEEVEIRSKTKWSGAELLREEEVEEEIEGKKKKVRHYFYRAIQPTLPLLRQYLKYPEWLKLWRDMLWAIPRGNPQSREPFEQRVKGITCKEGMGAWSHLVKVHAAQMKNTLFTATVAGSLWLGAQATNAELVDFEGRAEQNLLLHFWPLTSLVYVPQVVKPDGSSELVGYVLAIPEVSNLDGFLVDYPLLLGGLGGQLRGYRPAESVIDLPAQAALSFLEHLARFSSDIVTTSELRYSISAAEYMHLAKFGNNIKTMASGRISPRPYLREEYLAIVGRPGDKAPYNAPLFRSGLMYAFLEERSWFEPFAKLLIEWPAEFFVRSESPNNLPWFWVDAQKKFEEVNQVMPTDSQPGDQLPDEDSILSTLLYRLTSRYLRECAKDKSGIDPEEYKSGEKIDWKQVPPAFNEARRALAARLFLEFRSRRDQAFVSHFAATFFAVKQFLDQEQYAEIGRALLRRTDDVKTLTLMALSANSLPF